MEVWSRSKFKQWLWLGVNFDDVEAWEPTYASGGNDSRVFFKDGTERTVHVSSAGLAKLFQQRFARDMEVVRDIYHETCHKAQNCPICGQRQTFIAVQTRSRASHDLLGKNDPCMAWINLHAMTSRETFPDGTRIYLTSGLYIDTVWKKDTISNRVGAALALRKELDDRKVVPLFT